MLTLTAGALFSVYLPMIGRRETRALEYVSLPLAAFLPQIMKRIGIIAFAGLILMAIGAYGHEWWLIGMATVAIADGFVHPLSTRQPATSVFMGSDSCMPS